MATVDIKMTDGTSFHQVSGLLYRSPRMTGDLPLDQETGQPSPKAIAQTVRRGLNASFAELVSGRYVFEFNVEVGDGAFELTAETDGVEIGQGKQDTKPPREGRQFTAVLP
jgi:hypothetical protein